MLVQLRNRETKQNSICKILYTEILEVSGYNYLLIDITYNKLIITLTPHRLAAEEYLNKENPSIHKDIYKVFESCEKNYSNLLTSGYRYLIFDRESKSIKYHDIHFDLKILE